MAIGKLFFALVDEAEVFDDGVHNREDLKVFNLKITQSESEFARAELLIQNPREGLLATTRKKRIFISCEETPDSPTIILLFSGRILALPTDLDRETVVLEYLAKPETWETDLQTAVDALKVAPYYNELFLAPEDRVENFEVLSAYSGLLEWDRALGTVEYCDFIQGTEFIDVGSDFIYDSLSLDAGDPPVTRMNLNIEAQWEQLGVGEVDVAEAIRQTFTNTAIATPQINTLTPQAFEAGWGKIQIPRGYELLASHLTAVANSFGLTQEDLSSAPATVDGSAYLTSEGFDTGGNRLCTVARVWYEATLLVLGTYRQKRREQARASVLASVQPYTVSSEVVEELSLRIQDPVAAVNGAVLDPGYPSFFLLPDLSDFSTYGQQALEYGLLRCVARLKKAARCAEVTFSSRLENFLGISCRHSLRITGDVLPNETLGGKVVSYVLEVDGPTGRQLATMTIGCVIGNGEDSVAELGDLVVAEETYTNETTGLSMDSALYYALGAVDIDVPIDVQQMETDDQYLIDAVTTQNDGETQNEEFSDSTTPDVYLQNNKTSVVVDLKTLNPSAELFNEVEIETRDLTLPQQINLGDP